MTYVIMFGMETNLCHLVGTTMDRYFQARSRENDSHKGCWVLPGHVLDLGFTLLSEFRYRCLAALAQNVDDISEWAQNGAKPDEWFWIPATAKHTIIYFQHFSKLEQFKGFLKIRFFFF